MYPAKNFGGGKGARGRGGGAGARRWRCQ